MKVKKRNGEFEEFDQKKIIRSIHKANSDVLLAKRATQDECIKIAYLTEVECEELNRDPTTKEIRKIICEKISDFQRKDLIKEYRDFQENIDLYKILAKERRFFSIVMISTIIFLFICLALFSPMVVKGYSIFVVWLLWLISELFIIFTHTHSAEKRLKAIRRFFVVPLVFFLYLYLRQVIEMLILTEGDLLAKCKNLVFAIVGAAIILFENKKVTWMVLGASVLSLILLTVWIEKKEK